jgi:uncharacterized membrane protein
MASRAALQRADLSRAIAVSLLCIASGRTALAGSIVLLSPPAGHYECIARAVNNDQQVAGVCSPQNGSGPSVAFVNQRGTSTALPALVPGEDCESGGITNSGLIVGVCLNSSGTEFAATWQANNPTTKPMQLQPLSGRQGVGADVSSFSNGFSSMNAVIGESVSGDGKLTPVIWPAGQSSAIPLDTWDSHCTAIDADDSSASTPNVILNCRSSTDRLKPYITRWNGRTYVATPLRLPAEVHASYCAASGINNKGQIVGTCHTKAPGSSAAAFWSAYNVVPQMAFAIVNGRPVSTNGAFINNQGHVVVDYQITAKGALNAGFWDPNGGRTITLIPLLPGGARAIAMGLAENDRVILTDENSSKHDEAASWTPRAGTVAEGFVLNGQESAAMDVNTQGTCLVGVGKSAAGRPNAVIDCSP